MQSYADQVVLITGAGTGIGRQLALEFARRGARIAAIDLTEEPLVQLMADLKQSGSRQPHGWKVADVSQREAMHDAITGLHSQLSPVDVVIANAGVGMENPIDGFSAEIFARQIAVNLLGIAYTLEPVLPGLIARRRGHIVALSSLASYRGLPLMAGYCASKAGASAFMDSLRVELRASNIHCTTICPGFIKTNMTKDIATPTPGGIMDLEYAVNRMMRAIEKKQPYLAFPAGNRFLLALNRILPARVGDYLTLLKMGAALKPKPEPQKLVPRSV